MSSTAFYVYLEKKSLTNLSWHGSTRLIPELGEPMVVKSSGDQDQFVLHSGFEASLVT